VVPGEVLFLTTTSTRWPEHPFNTLRVSHNSHQSQTVSLISPRPATKFQVESQKSLTPLWVQEDPPRTATHPSLLLNSHN